MPNPKPRPLLRPMAGVRLLVPLVATAAFPALAAEPPPRPSDPPDRLETLVVTATRTERDVREVPATVSVMTAEEIEQQLARSIRDLVRYEPGVSIGGTGSRFGLGSFNIRGIGGNRVLTVIDGVRIADSYSFGPFLSANRDYVDVDGLKAFEIVRGPASSLYGSDALGGVVAYRTKTARDYLDGQPFHAGVKAGYSGVDAGSVGTVTLAAGSDRLDGLLLYTRRSTSELENHGGRGGTGPSREQPDPFERDADNVVVKLGFRPGEQHEIELSADRLDSRTESRVLSNYGTMVGTTLTRSQDAFDTIDRERYGLRYTLRPIDGAVDLFSVQVYSQRSDQSQVTLEERLSTTSGLETLRSRESYFEQQIDGVNLQVDRAFDTGAWQHYLVVGGEYWTTDSEALRDGRTLVAGTGAELPEFNPLPTRDFPLTQSTQYGVFVQDEITVLDSRLLLTPGLRLDAFDARATADPVYLSGNPGQPAPEDIDDSAVSPKLGALYRFTDRLSLYAQYAEGFKAPPYGDVNVGFSNPIGGYKTISNPDLESERSQSLELGLRVATDRAELSVVAFRNRYDDFIESLLPASEFAATGGIDPADGLLTFQSQNIPGVVIEGVEVSGRVALALDARLALDFAAAYADGEDRADGTPLNSIEPLTGVLGLSYRSATGRWGGDLIWTLVAEKSTADINGNRLPAAGYGVVDLLGHFAFSDQVRLDVGLFNLGDKRYIRWVDTASIAFDSTTGRFAEAARFTQPGFNAGMTLRVEF